MGLTPLLYLAAGAGLLYLAGQTADEIGETADQAANFNRTVLLLLAAGAAAVYLPRLLR